MRKLFLVLVVGSLLAGLYVTRDRWIDQAPQWLAERIRSPSEASGAGAQGNASEGSAKTGARSSDAAAAGSGSGGSGSGSGKGRGGSRQVAVTTANATEGSLAVTRRTIGYVRPLASTTMASETIGIIAEIGAKDGSSVKAGDLLVRLDDRAARAVVAKDEAALARDQATLDNARAQLDRIQRLVTSGASTAQAGDDAAATVKSAEATVNVDRAALTADQVALSKTELRAPFDGRIGAYSVSLGSLVQAGTAIVTLTEIAPVYAEFSLPETDLALVRKSIADKTLTVEVKASLAGDDAPVERGPVVFIDNMIDEASASIRMRAMLSNDDRALLPGQSIDVSLAAGLRDGLVLVPGIAVEPRDTGSIVYLVKPDNTIEVRKVEVAMRNADLAGISAGLSAGDKVVVEGQVELANGTAVRDVGKKPSEAKPTDAKAPQGEPANGKPVGEAPAVGADASKGGPA